MNEQWAMQQQNGAAMFPDAGANGLLDASMFNGGSVDVGQFSNPQMQQRMQNGGMRNVSPAFPNPQYNVNPIVPAKRSRPSEDGITASPRPHPNLNPSRSQTPGSGFQGFPGTQQQHPNPYQHLQQTGSNNATPSPTLQDSQFRPPTAQSRMNASPSPFPNAQVSMGMSPTPDANGNRVNTPHNPNFAMAGMAGMGMPSTTMAQGFPGFGGNMNPAQLQSNAAQQGVRLPQNLAQQQEQTQRLYQMQMMQQQAMAQGNLTPQQRQQMTMINQMGAAGQAGAMSTPTRNPQQPAQQAAMFMRNVSGYMQQQGKPFDPSPTAGGKPLNLYGLYAMVMKARGSQTVTARNLWPNIAQGMGFPPQIAQQVAAEVRSVYERNLGPYESFLWRAKQESARGAMLNTNQTMPPNQQMSPTRAGPPSQSDLQRQQIMHQQRYSQQMQQRNQQPNSAGQMTPQQSNAHLASANGWTTPQYDAQAAQRPGSVGGAKSVKSVASPSLQQPFPSAPPTAALEKFPDGQATPVINGDSEVKTEETDPTTYDPKILQQEKNFGGLPLESLNVIGTDIDIIRPQVPECMEMGVIDIRALSLSLQSGLECETRHALDTFLRLTCEQRACYCELEHCQDLADVLVEFAEDQVDLLREEASEVSDVPDLASYEDVHRASKAELESLQDIPAFGTKEYELDRAADRLIAVTSILRNLSFWPTNQPILAAEAVVRLISRTINLVGTRSQLFRSYTNTQDFMKDALTLLSNIATDVELPSQDDALNVLEFLLAFAPQPSPSSSPTCLFTRFQPITHPYLPSAIDVLAKLLARDDPNRTHFRHVFQTDPAFGTCPNAPLHQRYSLLTRSFGLAISIIPDRSSTATLSKGGMAEYRMAEIRKPQLIQGMLAADILANILPNMDSGLARCWLSAEDGWAPALLRMCCTLSSERSTHPGNMRTAAQRASQQQAQQEHEMGLGMIARRGLSMLQTLGERMKPDLQALDRVEQSKFEVNDVADEHDASDNTDGEVNGAVSKPAKDDDELSRQKLLKIMADILPQQEVLMGALLTPTIDMQALNQLVAFSQLAS